MKSTMIVLTAMMLLSPLSAEMLSSFSYRGDFNQEVSAGAVELKGQGTVNLVAVLEFIKMKNEYKNIKNDDYYKFMDHIRLGSKSAALKVLLEKPTIEASDLKSIRDNIQTAVSDYITSEAKTFFPSETINIDFGVIMLYVVDPADRKK